MPSSGLEQALRIVRRRAQWRRSTGDRLLALELDVLAANLAAELGEADTARLRTLRCPKCHAVVTVVRRRPTQ